MSTARSRRSGRLSATPRLTAKRLLGTLGPGLVTGASDDDPSGIATYAQAGAQYTYRSLWTVVLCLPLMIAVQVICDQTALATGKNLGELVRIKFSHAARIVVLVLLVALLISNGVNIAADLVAVGQGCALVHLGPAPVWSGVAGVGLMALLGLGSFEVVSRVFRFLCLSLLAYPAVLVLTHVDWHSVLLGLVGGLGVGSNDFWKLIVAILGTTLSPYLFFWQSAHRVEEIKEEESEGKASQLREEPTPKGATRRLFQSRVDVLAGMILSELVMFSIITATAATIGSKKSTTLTSAADAAKALQPLAGNAASLLFAVGFIGSGILAVPVLAASAATGFAGLTNHSWGFERKVGQAPLFYVLVGLGTLGGAVLSVAYADPFSLLVLSAVINGIAAAPFMIVVMLVARDRRLMGEFRIGSIDRVLGWIAVMVMATAGVVGVLTI